MINEKHKTRIAIQKIESGEDAGCYRVTVDGIPIGHPEDKKYALVIAQWLASTDLLGQDGWEPKPDGLTIQPSTSNSFALLFNGISVQVIADKSRLVLVAAQSPAIMERSVNGAVLDFAKREA